MYEIQKTLQIKNKLVILVREDAFSWSKVTVKTFVMLQKISISNKCIQNNVSQFPQRY